MKDVVRITAHDMYYTKREYGHSQIALRRETAERPNRTVEELDQAFAAYPANQFTFTEEEAYEIALRHHWRVVVNAPKRGKTTGTYYYLKGKDMSWQDAADKLADETDNSWGNASKWAAIVFWEKQTEAFSQTVGEQLWQKFGEDAVYLEDNNGVVSGNDGDCELTDSEEEEEVEEEDEECGAEYAERRACEEALDQHQRELAEGVHSSIVIWTNPVTGLRQAMV